MRKTDCNCTGRARLSRRQMVAFLAAFGVTEQALAQDAVAVDPRSYRVLVENERVRVLEYQSRPGFGVCGQGMHAHPDHVTVSLTGGKLKVTTSEGKTVLREHPPGHVFYAPAEVHSAEIIGGAGTRTLIIELKGKDWKPSTG
jgi:hypothetical protein